MNQREKKIERLVESNSTPCPSCLHHLNYTRFVDGHGLVWGLTKCPMNSSHFTHMKILGRIPEDSI